MYSIVLLAVEIKLYSSNIYLVILTYFDITTIKKYWCEFFKPLLDVVNIRLSVNVCIKFFQFSNQIHGIII